MKLEIIYEDKDFAAINKPAGVLFDWVIKEQPNLIAVHRLDKDTSGVILFAKNQQTADYLKSLFQAHSIKKIYEALVVGNIKEKNGTIDLTIARSARTPLKRISIGKKRGVERTASTKYKVFKRFGDYTLVEVCPLTGRTHQIRSHFSAIGHPVSCDILYGVKNPKCPLGLSRQFLHAKNIEFTLQNGGRIKLEADLPDDLSAALAKLHK